MQAPVLLMERKQKILFQPPVQKRADPRRIHDTQHSGLTQRQRRFHSRGNRTVLRIFIDKHLDLIAYLRAVRHPFCRQEHILGTAVVVIAQIAADLAHAGHG